MYNFQMIGRNKMDLLKKNNSVNPKEGQKIRRKKHRKSDTNRNLKMQSFI